MEEKKYSYDIKLKYIFSKKVDTSCETQKKRVQEFL